VTQDSEQTKQSFDLLDRTLDAYGGNASRWPDGVRARLSAFVDVNSEAQKRVAAAGALDQVLHFATKLSDAQNATLAEHIVARAAHQPRVVSNAGTPPPRRRVGWHNNHGMAGAALAASLLIGVLAGQNAAFATLTDVIAGGSANGALLTSQQVAQGDDADTALDEDLL
jgi:hypothetical protein